MNEFLEKANADWTVLEKLIDKYKLVEVKYKKERFYIRKLLSNKKR